VSEIALGQALGQGEVWERSIPGLAQGVRSTYVLRRKSQNTVAPAARKRPGAWHPKKTPSMRERRYRRRPFWTASPKAGCRLGLRD